MSREQIIQDYFKGSEALARRMAVDTRIARGDFSLLPPVETDPILVYFQSTGADGAYYTPWDKSTLFQDEAGTIPVVNNGDPTARLSDISGNERHFTVGISSKRPTSEEGYLRSDGVDDVLYSDWNRVDGSKIFISTVLSQYNKDGIQVILELSANSGGVDGGLGILSTSTVLLTLRHKQIDTFNYAITHAENQKDLITMEVFNQEFVCRVNGVEGYRESLPNTVGNPTEVRLFVRDSFYAHADLYGLVQLDIPPDTATRDQIEQHLASKAGVVL